MNYTEKVYLDRISPYLTNFTQKNDDVWNCKCPYCNDSKQNSKKIRGFFHIGDKGNLIYSCRNCSVAVPLGEFIREQFPSYHMQYKLDMFSNTNVKLQQTKPKLIVDKRLQTLRQKISTINTTYKPILELDKTHIARKYLEVRCIPDLSEFGFVDNFSRYVDEMTNSDTRYAKLPEDSRIIIPLKLLDGELVGFQGRSIADKSSLRYITVKIPDMEDEYLKIFGLNRYNKSKAGFVVEGPIDSMFLPNTIAMCGTSLDMQVVKRGFVIPDKTIIIIDNEPRNPQIVDRMGKYVDAGFRIYVPPNGLNTIEKDINKMVLSGWSKSQLVELFVKNSYTGIKAKLKISEWKRVK